MGYAYGIKWTEEKIIESIEQVRTKLKISTMPTKTQMINVTGSYALSCAMSKRGGTKHFAKMLGLEIKPSESRVGEEYELLTMSKLTDIGYKCEKMPHRHPYDLLVSKNIKIDVKVSNIVYTNNVKYYSFNLEKKYATCDIFICYCLNDKGDVVNTYIIPSSVVAGKTQLSIGINKSKYDSYIDRWDILEVYNNFNKAFI